MQTKGQGKGLLQVEGDQKEVCAQVWHLYEKGEGLLKGEEEQEETM